MTIFDPQAFMETAVVGAMDTKTPIWPPGEYIARITKVDIKPWESAERGTSGLRADLYLETDDPRVTSAGARTLVHGIMLDLNEQGGLDDGRGKNIKLGQVREAVGQNEKGKEWKFPMLIGQVMRVQVTHFLYKGEPRHQVSSVAAV